MNIQLYRIDSKQSVFLNYEQLLVGFLYETIFSKIHVNYPPNSCRVIENVEQLISEYNYITHENFLADSLEKILYGMKYYHETIMILSENPIVDMRLRNMFAEGKISSYEINLISFENDEFRLSKTIKLLNDLSLSEPFPSFGGLLNETTRFRTHKLERGINAEG